MSPNYSVLYLTNSHPKQIWKVPSQTEPRKRFEANRMILLRVIALRMHTYIYTYALNRTVEYIISQALITFELITKSKMNQIVITEIILFHRNPHLLIQNIIKYSLGNLRPETCACLEFSVGFLQEKSSFYDLCKNL